MAVAEFSAAAGRSLLRAQLARPGPLLRCLRRPWIGSHGRTAVAKAPPCTSKLPRRHDCENSPRRPRWLRHLRRMSFLPPLAIRLLAQLLSSYHDATRHTRERAWRLQRHATVSQRRTLLFRAARR